MITIHWGDAEARGLHAVEDGTWKDREGNQIVFDLTVEIFKGSEMTGLIEDENYISLTAALNAAAQREAQYNGDERAEIEVAWHRKW